MRDAPPALRPDDPLAAVRGIGPSRQRTLAELGIRRVSDLLLHLPHRYEDRRQVLGIGAALALLPAGGNGVAVTIAGRLRRLRRVPLRRRRLTLVQGEVEDAEGSLRVSWFNRPYLPSQVNEETEYLLHGTLRHGRQGVELLNPSCEPAAAALAAGVVVPIYPSLGAFGPAAVRRLLANVLAGLDVETAIAEPLPAELRQRHCLPALGAALAALHAPPASADVETLNQRRSPAHQRLIYGELLALQLELLLLRAQARKQPKQHRYRIDDRLRALARALLPFRLTAAQQRVVREIVADLRAPEPMLRLLQGDVGCGKTIVAALVIVAALESGLQAAFMAPTELLAEQQFLTLERLLGERYRLALITASSGSGAAERRRLESGETQLAVGTHALIQERIAFARLGLAVIDEQHRFGVAQRQLLQRKGERPDLLVMTATPIPRSLALTAYGDLDLSVIDELPPGRQPVQTEVAPESARRRVYHEVRAELAAAGGQAFVVFPLIDDSEHLPAASVEKRGAEVQALLGADCRTAIVHGRTPRDERERVMRELATGRLQVLLATTVIEVGVDVPGARLMVIESAERFGLAQLHQLRGRVGRGSEPSRCVALHGRLTAEARRRLEVFATAADGFAIAEADLEIRGPGDLLGTRQAGLPRFRVANLLRDWDWLRLARADALSLLPRLDQPELAALRRRAERQVGRHPFAGG